VWYNKRYANILAEIAINMNKHYTEKLKNLVLYILSSDEYKDGGIKKLNKFLYFIDFYFYRDHEQFISGKEIQYAKAPMGPIIDNYKTIFDEMCSDEVLTQEENEGVVFHKPCQKPNLSLFTSDEIDHIHNLLHNYGRLSSVELESISHEQQPWVLTENYGDIIDPDLALLMSDKSDESEEVEVGNESLRNELVNLANSV